MKIKFKIFVATVVFVPVFFGLNVKAQTMANYGKLSNSQIKEIILILQKQIDLLTQQLVELTKQNVCGNGKCEFGETAIQCRQDCGGVPCVQKGKFCCKEFDDGDSCSYSGRFLTCKAGLTWPATIGCDDQCNPIFACSDCAAEGNLIFSQTTSGPTKCCDAGSGVKPNFELMADGSCGGSQGEGICFADWKSCGNGICESHKDENLCTCSQDCCSKEGQVVRKSGNCCAGLIKKSDNRCVKANVCGNGVCESGEGCGSCSVDCGVCSVPCDGPTCA